MRRSGGLPFLSFVLLGALVTAGCGDDDDDLGPGGSTFTGNVSSAVTAAAEPSWMRSFAEVVLGFARPAWAQNVGLGGVTVIVRSSDREVSSVTSATGGFTVEGAPTGDVVVLLRRDSCEAGFPIAQVPSRSTITLQNVTFDCTSASPGAVFETLEAVLRDEPVTASDLDLCARAGNDEQLRDADASGATVQRQDGQPGTIDDLEDDDLLRLSGRRAGTGSPGSLDVSEIRIVDRDVNDPCDDNPVT